MENLVPREVYDIDESGYRRRLGRVTGVFFGVAMGIACFILTYSMLGIRRSVLLSICTAAFCGIVFGYIFRKRLQKKMSSMIDRLYSGNPDLEIAPPPEKNLRFRLPSSWKRSDNFSVGGVLYIGPSGLLFVPHKLNLPRDRSIFEMGPIKSLELSLTSPALNKAFKLLVPRPTPLLQVAWPDGSAQFLIPAPNQGFKLIGDRLHEMKQN